MPIFWGGDWLLEHNTNAIRDKLHDFYSSTDAGPSNPPPQQCAALAAKAEVQQNTGSSILLFLFKLSDKTAFSEVLH